MKRDSQGTVRHEIESRPGGGATIVRVSGRFGQEAAEDLFDVVTSSHDDRGFVLDLSGVEFIGSSAIGCLVRLAVDHGPIVVLPSIHVQRALDLAEVSAFIRIRATVEEGMALLASEGRNK